MNSTGLIQQRLASILESARLPARLNTEQVAHLLGFQPHDVPLLTKAGLLKPLGGGPRNSVKYFASCEIDQFRNDHRWLDKATRAVSRRDAPRPKQFDSTTINKNQ